jgi:hypothetical protein
MLRVFLLIVVGLAGDPEHGEAFRKWGASLADTAGRLGVAGERMVFLADEATKDARVSGRATRAGIEKAFETFAKDATADDVLMVVLFGHGSFDGRTAKFNLQGPDMAPADFNVLLRGVASQHVVFVNTASASGPFVQELSGPGRTIVTATRNGAEQFATLFGGYFVDALTTDAADADKNKRISVLEAFLHARGETERAYKREGLLSTEHALLDDDGNKEGSGEPSATAADGKKAALLSLGAAGGGDALPADPKLRALYVERREIERRLEALKLLKGSMESSRYLSELEALVTSLALKSREIRVAEGKQ